MNRIIFVLTFALVFSSCSKSFDIQPQSTLTNASMWKTQSDVDGAVNGMYSQLRVTLNTNIVFWGDYRSGTMGNGLAPSSESQDMYNNSLDRDDSGTDWKNLYTTINDANLIIRYIDQINFTNENNKKYYLANAYFVRGLCYFYAARVWGDAPIVLSGFVSDNQEDMFPTRKPVSEVLDQAAADADMSVSLLADNNSKNRYLVTKGAANMLVADIALWMYGKNTNAALLTKAKNAVNAVMSAGYTISPTYESIFSSETNAEVIFGINFLVNEYVGGFANEYLIPIQFVQDVSLRNNPILVGSTQQRFYFSNSFDAFLKSDPTDTRIDAVSGSYVDQNMDIKWIKKFPGQWLNGTRVFDSDIVLYRLTEAILFDAEIDLLSNDKDAAIGKINQIAKRAYGVDNYYSTSLTDAQVRDVLVDERMKEFVLEGKTWFDLIRLGKVFDRVATLQGKESQQNILLWPVNTSSINTNPNIVQTPGYN